MKGKAEYMTCDKQFEVQTVSVEQRKLDYLLAHHEATETSIGCARLHLKEGDAEKALRWLDLACEKIDALSRKRRLTPPNGGDDE